MVGVSFGYGWVGTRVGLEYWVRVRVRARVRVGVRVRVLGCYVGGLGLG